MKSLVLRTSTWLMIPVLLLFSIFLLLRGHNAPGGGFVGGLVAASAVLLQLIATGPVEVRRLIPFDIKLLMPVGLLVAVLSGLPALALGQPFLTGVWVNLPIGDGLKLGTPAVFDVGVYLVVLGIAVQIILSMAEEEQWS
ncbi:MAG TPA: Na+/H+ antiporter subunit B [Anaerolineae bacterium]|nr:Na+/H+ antiporter subunit B [Anaerolineae bacterium]